MLYACGGVYNFLLLPFYFLYLLSLFSFCKRKEEKKREKEKNRIKFEFNSIFVKSEIELLEKINVSLEELFFIYADYWFSVADLLLYCSIISLFSFEIIGRIFKKKMACGIILCLLWQGEGCGFTQ